MRAIGHISFIAQEALMVFMGVLAWNAVGWWLGVVVVALGTVLVAGYWSLAQNYAEYRNRTERGD